ncbi:MAG: hypothetical protein AAF518_28955 [Spirochaetota bacterium]
MLTIAKYFLLPKLFLFSLFLCDNKPNILVVQATAYNSVKSQTSDNPTLAAWGDTLSPGMKIVAVSRDLIKLGLDHNTEVKIQGFEGSYVVKDKMNRRWKQKIDIYMGLDVKAAKKWGIRKVNICW